MNTTSDTPDFNNESYRKAYDEGAFWNKLNILKSRVGRPPLVLALKAYYVMIDSDTPIGAKLTVMAALGYVILPLDLIPDFMPVAGLIDDAAALTTALTIVAAHVKPEHLDRAEKQADTLLGSTTATATSL
jgi:uncharacterized membrane protein YkvA (DUF1232 family)